MVACLDTPDLAATGDRIERVEDERRALAAAVEDYLHGELLSPIDPADLHGLSASIALLTHRTARALYFFSLLGNRPAVGDLRSLSRLLADSTAELVGGVEDLAGGRTRAISTRVRSVRRFRDESHVHVGKVLAIEATTEDRDVLLWRTVGETIDNASAQALVVAAETARVATKHD